MPRRWRVALAGYYGFSNLGDELLLRASIEALERAGVGREEIVVLSNDPEGTSRDRGVASVSRWSLREVLVALTKSRTLLLGGGGLFQDSTSLRSCLWYWGLVRLARLCGARPWALGQSIGPLRSPVARWSTRDALRSCRPLHVRDAPSMAWAERLGLRATHGEDLALTLETPSREDRPREDRPTLLINVRPHADAGRFVEVIAPHVAAHARHGEAVGVALSPEDEALLAGLREEGSLALSRVVRPTNMDDAAALWGGASRAVGMRLHFAVLSALFDVPLAVSPYDPKVSAFAARVGAPCISDRWIEPRRPVLPATSDAIRQTVDAVCRRALAEGP